MRRLFTLLWLIIPVALVAYHYGPGQLRLARDRASRQITAARAAQTSGNWKAAEASYRQALQDLPTEDIDVRLAARLAHAKTRIYLGELPEAMADVESLLGDALRDSTDEKLQNQIRSTAGSMHYWVAWLMRLEGAETDEWTEQTESARQYFRLLAEEAVACGDKTSAEGHQKNLEAAIRLARMDLSELKGLPLPSECNGNCNCSGKCRSQKESRSKVGKKPGDAREQISEEKGKNAGAGNRPGGGS